MALMLLFSLGLAPFSHAQTLANVAIDATQIRQTMDGFGAFDAQGSCFNTYGCTRYNAYPPLTSAQADFYFTSSLPNSLGLSLLRIAVPPYADGSSQHPWFYNSGDIRLALARGVKIWADAERPPSADLLQIYGPAPCSTSRPCYELNATHPSSGVYAYYADFAATLVAYAQAFQTTFGTTLYALNPQNEPNNPGFTNLPERSHYGPYQYENFVTDYLKPAFVAAGLTTKILGAEEAAWSWNYVTPVSGEPSIGVCGSGSTNMPLDVFAAHHYHGGTPTAPPFTCVPIWETEVFLNDAGSCVAGDDNCISPCEFATCQNNGQAAYTLAQQINDFTQLAGASAYQYFLLTDQSTPNKPDALGYEDSSGNTTTPIYAYALGQYSRWVRPGWKRIASDGSALPARVKVSAYMDPTATQLAIVFVNPTPNWVTLTLSLKGISAPAGLTNWYTFADNGFGVKGLTEGSSQAVGSTVWLYPYSVQTLAN
jgi:glucuronoarabinoxylan endo-1,4-beta-xylanase